MKGTVQDITARKRAEEILRKSEEKFRKLIEQSPIVYEMYDRDGVQRMVNSAYGELWGIDPQTTVGAFNVWKMVQVDLLRPYLERAYAGETVSLPDSQWNPKKEIGIGRERWISTKIFPFLDNQGEVENIVILHTDITERKQAEEELLKARKLESIGILAGGIAHDFNNLLMAVSGNISLAKALIDSKEDVEECLNEMEKAAVRAQSLTQQLLTFSKGGAPVKEFANVIDIIKDTAAFTLRGSNVTCSFDFPKDLWLVNIDKGQFSQVIQNLVMNAIQAMPNGGTIHIKGENITIGESDLKDYERLREGAFVKITFQDQGTGISEEDQQKIFDPYFTTKAKGSGLGLATTYSIMKNHGGMITVDSQIGSGAVFTLHLPFAAKENQSDPKTAPDVILMGDGRILLMDDEKIIRDVVGKMLRQIGYEVDFAVDGHEAIAKYNQTLQSGNPYDAVIMDLTIPGGMGGKEAIQRLLEINPRLKAIVSSGYSGDPILSNYQEYGFQGVITKPYQIEKIGKVLHDVLHEQNGMES